MQPLSFGEFFDFQKSLCSTMVGASNLALALGTSTVFVGPIGNVMSRFKAFVNANPMAGVLLVLNLHQQLRHSQLVSAVRANKSAPHKSS